MNEPEARLTGGCQCGAIRYAVHGEPMNPLICHCRMCQKAFAAIAVAFFTVRGGDLEWTRGQPAIYRSSEAAERGFCAACGTPLSFQQIGEDTLDMALGSLDEPARVKPLKQYWTGTRMPWFRELSGLPEIPASVSATDLARRKSRQHPDHDTDVWPPPIENAG